MMFSHLAKSTSSSLSVALTLVFTASSVGVQAQSTTNGTRQSIHTLRATPKPPAVQAQFVNPDRQLSQGLRFATPKPPDDIGEPGERVEASSRGDCEQMNKQMTGAKQKQLTALVPAYGQLHSGLVLGKTAAAHPTFWFYVPYSSTIPGKFVLQESEKTLYQTRILSREPGVVKVTLPTTTPDLKIGHRYHWFFNIYCHAGQPDAFVHGWIERDALNSNLKSWLERATLKQRVALLAANGIWYDALTASSELRYTNPKDPSWTNLLLSVGLSDVALEPLSIVVTESEPIAH